MRQNFLAANRGKMSLNILSEDWKWTNFIPGFKSGTLAWKIPWTEEPGGLQSIGSLRVGHDWATSLSLFTFMHWRRRWRPTPVSLPGESQGRGSLVGCRLWDHTESDTTEATQQQQQQQTSFQSKLLNSLFMCNYCRKYCSMGQISMS